MSHHIFDETFNLGASLYCLDGYDSRDVTHHPIVPERNLDSPDEPIKFEVNVFPTIDLVPGMYHRGVCHYFLPIY